MIDFTFLAQEQSTNELLTQANEDYRSARRMWWGLVGILGGMGTAYVMKQPNTVQVAGGLVGGGAAWLAAKATETA